MKINNVWSAYLNKIFCIRAVGHVNIDLCTSGGMLELMASPSLKSVALKALQGVTSVESDKESSKTDIKSGGFKTYVSKPN